MTALLIESWLVLVAIQAPNPEQIEVATEDLIVSTDGKGHYLAAASDLTSLYYGDGKTFFRLERVGTGGSGDVVTFEDARLAGWHPRFSRLLFSQSSLARNLDAYSLQCGDRYSQFKTTTQAEGVELLTGATFKRPPHPWKPYALARNDHGVYYYVDKGRWPDNEKRFRVFAGPKGDMKLLKLRNIVSDSEGTIFSTTRGDLRLIFDKNEGYWVQKNKRTKLTVVPTGPNIQMIYIELGVYIGIRLGTPCDDF